ncbi:MAG TPA: arylamine N-acetyltransferase [Gammaproteobacteria bacterium]|nr:arylamine N-acetyltransferase [Gammaproteobacteria bacterium]
MADGAFPLDAYLERIAYSGRVAATESGLERLQRGQLRSIPFENFDILLGRGISLEPPAICDKLLLRRRGGYCFELNGLLLLALRAIGFEARPLLARVHLHGRASGRTHALLLVTIGARCWLADAGFGGPSLRAPIPLERDVTRDQEGYAFRLTDGGAFGTMLQSLVDGAWRDLYSFDLGHVWPADIALSNHFASTHPSSFFTFARVAAIHTPVGRVALLDHTLRRIASSVEQVEHLVEGPEFIAAIERHFGIAIDAPYQALRPLRANDEV